MTPDPDERAVPQLSAQTLALFAELLSQLSISAASADFDAQCARVSTARRELHDALIAAGTDGTLRDG